MYTQAKDPEVATSDFKSGGGFSNAFALPSWQQRQVGDYIAQHTAGLAPGAFNRSGRAQPDLAANG